jgi:hypothetical protein
VHPLKTLLTDVKRFVEETKEILFLDFHSFPIGFTSEAVHEELLQYVIADLGKHLVPRTYPSSVTPNMLWRANKTVIWTYAEEGFMGQEKEENKVLWPYLMHVSTSILGVFKKNYYSIY